MCYIIPQIKQITQLIKEQKIIVIVGPTASGKSDLGIKLAEKYNGEIISADSRQVYRGMNLGTGKVLRDKTLPVPNAKFKYQNEKLTNGNFYSRGIRHHLIDVASPKKQFTAEDFKRLGEKAIKEITAKGKVPIIIGGTGFYIDILLGRMQTAQVPPNPKLRKKLEKQSTEQLYQQLTTLDPIRAQTIDRHNKRRLIRALEIVLTTGKPISNAVVNGKYNVLWLGMSRDKKELAQKITKRLDARLKQSMIKEVENLHKHGVSWKRLDDLGLEYRWVSRWLIQKSKIKMQSYNAKLKNFKNSEYYERLLTDIIKYSKRQMTWFRKNEEIKWIKDNKTAESLVQQFID